MIMRDIKVVYVPPVCTPKVVRGGDLATWEGVSARLLAAHVPGVTSNTYLELYYPNEGFVCPLASDVLPDGTLTVSVHIELTGGQAVQFATYSETVTGEAVVGAAADVAGNTAPKVAVEAGGGNQALQRASVEAMPGMDRRAARRESKLQHKEEKMTHKLQRKEEKMSHKLEKINAKLEDLRLKNPGGQNGSLAQALRLARRQY